MKNKIIGFILISIFSTYSSFCYAQENLDGILLKLKDPDWRVRFKVLYELTEYPSDMDKIEIEPRFKAQYVDNEKVKDAIYELADLEKKLGKPEKVGEGYSNQKCYLYRVIGSFREERAIPYLIDGACHPENELQLVKIGEPAVDPIIKSKSWYRIFILSEMIKERFPKHKISQQSIIKIKKVLLHIFSETSNNKEDPKIIEDRLVALKGLGELAYRGDKEVISLIQKIVTKDPYFQDFSKKPNCTGPKIRYPVREEAQKVLEKLKKEGNLKE